MCIDICVRFLFFKLCVCVCARARMCACVCQCEHVCVHLVHEFIICMYVFICICVHVYMCTQHMHIFGPFHNDLVRVSDQGVHILDHWFYIKYAGFVLDT